MRQSPPIGTDGSLALKVTEIAAPAIMHLRISLKSAVDRLQRKKKTSCSRTQCQSCLLARRAPSTRALNLAQTMDGCTSLEPANEANPQSALAITRSRPTTSAK